MRHIAYALILCLPALVSGATVGGKTAPDGTPLQVDLPGEFHKANIASKGLGCCVFRSIDHAAHYQLIDALYGMPEWMKSNGIAGGGWPEKVDNLIPQICKDRKAALPDYIQIEGPWTKCKPLIDLACKTNRMVCITYERSPTGRYGGGKIAHMVNMTHADGKWYVFLDNNYVTPKEGAYEWCSESEASWAAGGSSVWCIIFLDQGPPPIPRPFKDHDEISP